MHLEFDHTLAHAYSSASQRARVMTEHWLLTQGFCPACGGLVEKYPNNRPVADFHCRKCGEEFELKSQAKLTVAKIVDGAYHTMIQRITSNRNPNFFLLAYNPSILSVTDLIVIPKHFFSPDIIEQRRPLAATARRKGWIGCNIKLEGIPLSGRISIVRSGQVCPKSAVSEAWHRTLFLREQGNQDAKGWLLAVMRVIENLRLDTFSLAEVYASALMLKSAYPNNQNIEAKIRQQLQILRDRGYLRFLGSGRYALTAPDQNITSI